jgi:hypothetical protein
MATWTTGVENTLQKPCQFCGQNEQHRILPEQLMYYNPDTHGACVQCEKKMSEEEKSELYRITPQSIYWYPETRTRNDHLVLFWAEEKTSAQGFQLCLPELAIFHIFLMLTVVCRTTDEFIRVIMNFMKAMRYNISPTSFLAHLKAIAPKHHKIWHDVMMSFQHSHYGQQNIPECLGHVCSIQAANNPQLERIDIPGMGWHRAGNTSVGTCGCSHQTKWDIDFLNFSVLKEDGCYSLGNIIDIIPFNARHRARHDSVLCAKHFIQDLEEEYREQFLADLRQKLALSADEHKTTHGTQVPEPVIPFFHPDGFKEDTYTRKHWKDRAAHSTSGTKPKNKHLPRIQKKVAMRAFCEDFALV